MNNPPPLASDAPPLLSPQPGPGSGRRLLAIVLSLCLGLFLVDAAISFLDDFLILAYNCHALSFFRGLIAFATLFMTIAVYALIGLTPLVPKRLFLPLPLFNLLTFLAILPLTIYFYSHLQQIVLGISACQFALGLFILYRAQGGLKFSWPPVNPQQLGTRAFSLANLSIFVLVNAFVLVPAAILYLFICSAHAVAHFSEGFVALRPAGLTVQMRKYVRNDGKTIELFPMAHVADADFYSSVSLAFPTNSIVLMEGVTDEENLLTNKISYKRMAKTLGLAEQKQTFSPTGNQGVRADVDIDQFSKQTIDFLNVVMLIHSKGATAENLSKLMQWSPSPGFEKQLFDDILVKRNAHLVQEIQSYLEQSDSLVVPWGAAHMPGIAREIQKAGFHLVETHDYFAIRFRKTHDTQTARQ